MQNLPVLFSFDDEISFKSWYWYYAEWRFSAYTQFSIHATLFICFLYSLKFIKISQYTSFVCLSFCSYSHTNFGLRTYYLLILFKLLQTTLLSRHNPNLLDLHHIQGIQICRSEKTTFIPITDNFIVFHFYRNPNQLKLYIPSNLTRALSFYLFGAWIHITYSTVVQWVKHINIPQCA